MNARSSADNDTFKPRHFRRSVRWFAIGAILLGTLAVLEISARAFGIRPIYNKELDRITASLRVEPGGTICKPDDEIGYVNRPGHFEMSFMDRKWRITHADDGERLAGQATARSDDARPQIWFFGCSFTHGFGVDDGQTFCAQLQEMLPRFRIVNFGVDGYGDLQAMLLFRRQIAVRPRPALVVLGYASFHDIRNTQARSWRQQSLLANRSYRAVNVPFAELNDKGELRIETMPLAYDKLPGERYSSLITLIQLVRIGIDPARRSANDVTDAVVWQFASECEAAGTRLLVLGIAGDGTRMEEWSRQNLIDRCYVGFPPEPGDMFAPDYHPTPKGHRKLAERVLAALFGWRVAFDQKCHAAIEAGEDRNDSIRVAPVVAGTQPWQLRLDTPTIQVRAGDRLRLQAELRAVARRSFTIRSTLNHEPWSSIKDPVEATIDKDWRSVEHDVVIAKDDSVRLEIQFGGDATAFEVNVPRLFQNDKLVDFALPRD